MYISESSEKIVEIMKRGVFAKTGEVTKMWNW